MALTCLDSMGVGLAGVGLAGLALVCLGLTGVYPTCLALARVELIGRASRALVWRALT